MWILDCLRNCSTCNSTVVHRSTISTTSNYICTQQRTKQPTHHVHMDKDRPKMKNKKSGWVGAGKTPLWIACSADVSTDLLPNIFRTSVPEISVQIVRMCLVAGMPDISRQLFPDVSRSWLPDTCDQCWSLMSGSTIVRHLRLMLVGCAQTFAINFHQLLYNCMAVCLALAARALRVCGERTACEMNSRVHFGAPTP